MITPSLILSPDGSRDPNNVAVTPTSVGAVRTVTGRYGNAWLVEESTTNLFPNPSAFTNATGVTGVNGTVTRATSLNAATTYRIGFRLQITNTASAPYFHTTAQQVPISGTSPVTFSCMTYGPAGKSVSLRLNFRNASGTGLAHGGPDTVVPTTGSWSGRVSVTATPPAGAATCYVFVICGSPRVVDELYYITDIQIEEKGFATSFTAGDLGTGYAWTGTAHASTSTRAFSYLSLPATLARIHPNQGTVLIRYRKSLHMGSNNYLFWVGTHGVAGSDWMGLNTSGADNALPTTFYARWRRGADAETLMPTDQRPLAPSGSTFYTGAMSWGGTSWKSKLGAGNSYLTIPRLQPIGTWSGNIMIGRDQSPTTANAEIESIVVFQQELDGRFVDALINMPAAWTYANIQKVQPPSASIHLIG